MYCFSVIQIGQLLLYYYQVNLESWGNSGELKVSTGKTEYKQNAETYFAYYNMLKTGADPKLRKSLPTFMIRKNIMLVLWHDKYNIQIQKKDGNIVTKI